MVTPEIATTWLKYNLINRALRPAVVKFLAMQITLGRWIPNGDGIDFRKDGVLMNGQHRLHAIIMAGVAVKLMIVPDLDEEVFLIRDRFNPKTAADVLHLPSPLLADASLCYRVYVDTAGRIAEMDQRDIAAWWSPAHDTLSKDVKFTKGLSGAALRVGYGARWAMADPEDRAYVLEQFKALIASDVQTMSRATAVLWKRVLQHKITGGKGGVQGRLTIAAAAFYHADPIKRDVEPLIIDKAAILHELRVVIRNMEAAFIAAPLSAKHPYLFEQLPQTHAVKQRLRRHAARRRAMDDEEATRPEAT